MALVHNDLTTRIRRIALLMLTLVALVPTVTGSAPAAVAAQEEMPAPKAPRGGCFPGETPAQRIDGIIAVLIGFAAPPAELNTDESRQRCPGVSILPYIEQDNLYKLMGLPPDEIWSRYETGASLTEIGQDQGVERGAIVATLEATYRQGLDRALEVGVITEQQRQWLAERILPHFSWLVDWERDGPLAVATGDVDLDSTIDIIAACVQGENETARLDNLVRFLLGLEMPINTATSTTSDDDTQLLCSGFNAAFADGSVRFAVLNRLPPAESVYEDYLDGRSLLEIMAEWKRTDLPVLSPDLYQDLRASIDQVVENQVTAGQLSATDGERLKQASFLIIVVCLQHHHGDPLPTDFMNTTLDDEAAA